VKKLIDFSIWPVEVSQAKAGNKEAIYSLMKEASKILASREQLPDELSDWLAHALNQIATGGIKPHIAFCLNKKTGAKSRFTVDEEEMIANEVHYSNQGKHKADSTYSNENQGIYTLIGNRLGASPSTIENIYGKYRQGINEQEEVERENKT